MYDAFSATLRLIQEFPTSNHGQTGALVVGVPIIWLAESNTRTYPGQL